MEDGVLKITDSVGNEKEYSILFMFKEEENNEDYVVYTDYSKNEKGNINIYAKLYKKVEDKIQLFPIENKEINDFIDEKLEEIRKELLNVED